MSSSSSSSSGGGGAGSGSGGGGGAPGGLQRRELRDAAAFATSPPGEILVPPGEDMPYDPKDFDDSRAELKATGHNLTSVLMNPRETFFQDVFHNEFANSQAAPIASTIARTAPYVSSSSSSSSSGSTHSTHSTHSSYSSHSLSSSSQHASTSSKHYSNSLVSFQLLQITKLEEQQMQAFVDRIRKPYEDLLALQHLWNQQQTNAVGDDSDMTRPSLYKRNNHITNSNYNNSNSNSNSNNLQRCLESLPEFLSGPDFSLTNLDSFLWSIGDSAAVKRSKTSVSGNGNFKSGNGNDNSNSNSNSRKTDDELFAQTEVLTRLLDNVEITLLQYIWTKSPYFFGVIDDVRLLQILVSQLQKEIAIMRSRLDDVCSQISLTIMRIPKLHRRQVNETALHDKLVSMQRVIDGRKSIQKMLEIEDYWGALDLCSNIRNVYNGELHKIASMKGIGRELDECDVFICEVMCNRFVSVGMQWDTLVDGEDLEFIDSSSSSSSSNGVSSSSSSSSGGGGGGGIKPPSDNRMMMYKLIESLVAVEKFKPALNSYKSRLSDSIRLIIRTCVMEFLSLFDPTGVVDAFSNDVQEDLSNTQFSKQISSMTNDTFLACLCMCFEHITIALARANSVGRFVRIQLMRLLQQQKDADLAVKNDIHYVFENKLNNAASAAAAAENSAILLLEALLPFCDSCASTAGELAQKSVAQMLGLRKDMNNASKMSVENMTYFWRISTSFMHSLEKIQGSISAQKMRQVILIQSKTFLESLHEEHKASLVNTLDAEKWVQYDISPERQAEIDELVSGRLSVTRSSAVPQAAIVYSATGMKTGLVGDLHFKTDDASSSSRSTATSSSNSNTGGGSSNGNNSSSTSASSNKALAVASISSRSDYKPVVIDGVSYNVVYSLLKLIDLSLVYIDIIFSFPLVASDAIIKVVELLRLFDSRTRHLVLGAHAIHSAARLKSISAKHLAITAQSLSLLRSLLPHIRTVLIGQLPLKQHMLLTDFDKISHEFVDHHGQIVAKFVSIVSDMVESSAAKLKSVNWDRFQGQCEYFDEVLKNISALHRVLSAILPSEQLLDIFNRIFALLNRKIPQHFDDILPSTLTGRQRIVDEVVHIASSFAQLKHINSQGVTLLEEVFRKKYGVSPES